jgi:hypothetical protein
MTSTTRPSRIGLKITCDTGKTWSTDFNGSFADGEGYFLNKVFTDETEDGNETHHKCVRIELLP